MLTRFALRHLLRHWRLNLVVAAGLTLMAAFLAGLPAFATAIAGRGLRQQLANTTAPERNLLFTGPGLNDDFAGYLQTLFGDLLLARIRLDVVPPLSSESVLLRPLASGEIETIRYAEFMRLQPWTIDGAHDAVTVVDGRMPEFHPPDPGTAVSEVEAAVGVDTAENLTFDLSAGQTFRVESLQVGDRLPIPGGDMVITIVGLVEPTEPANDQWWDDLTFFSYTRASLNGPNSPETITLPLLLPQPGMAALFADTAVPSWRVLVDATQITVDNVDAVRELIKNAGSQLNVRLETSLLELLAGHQAELAAARVTLFLLTSQSIIFVLYTLAMISSFLLDQAGGVLATLVGRGFNSRQLTTLFAIQGAVVSYLVALPLGPLLALAALRLWGRLTDTAVSGRLAPDSWLLALAAVSFGWLTLVVAIYLNTRQNVLAWQRRLARPPRLAGFQKVYLDFFLLALGGLIYWQLRDTGTVMAQLAQGRSLAAAGLADPLLLLGPSLLLIAVALVFLRLFPALLRLAAWWARRRPSLILPLGLSKLARDPVGPSRVILLISMAAGLTLFASLMSHSLSVRQAQIAHYQAGADVRLGLPISAGPAEVAAVAALPGVQAVSPVYYNARSRLASNLGQQVEMLAVDPETLTAVARYAPFVSGVTLADVMPAVQGQGAGGAIPAVFSSTAPPRDKQVGDQIAYIVGTHRVTFEVRGIIRTFPRLGSDFYITNLAAIEEAVQLQTLTEPWVGRRELWLAAVPEQQPQLVRELKGGAGPFGSYLLDDAQARESALRSNLVAQETMGAFGLNALMLSLLSVAVFLMVHTFAAQQRRYEFSLLRATGLSPGQLLGLLSLEGAITMAVGLLAGVGLGLGLAAIMRPFLSRALSTAVGGDALRQLIVNWPEVSGLLGLLIGFYALALALLLAFLLRTGLHRALRLGEE